MPFGILVGHAAVGDDAVMIMIIWYIYICSDAHDNADGVGGNDDEGMIIAMVMTIMGITMRRSN